MGSNKSCLLCSDQRQIPHTSEEIVNHLLVFKTAKGHIHVHADTSNRAGIEELVTFILKESKIKFYTYSEEG